MRVYLAGFVSSEQKRRPPPNAWVYGCDGPATEGQGTGAHCADGEAEIVQSGLGPAWQAGWRDVAVEVQHIPPGHRAWGKEKGIRVRVCPKLGRGRV